MESFNARLKRLRTERNLSASEMARLINVAPTTYREWEYGRGMKFPPFLKISQVFAISVTELVTGMNTDPWPELKELEMIETQLRELRLKLLAMKSSPQADDLTFNPGSGTGLATLKNVNTRSSK